LRRSVISSLPAELFDRFAFGVIVAAERTRTRSGSGSVVGGFDLAEIVGAKAGAAVERSIGAWRRRFAGREAREVTCGRVSNREEPWLLGTVDSEGGLVRMGLRGTWLVDVWAWGIHLVDGCFVLDVIDGSSPDILYVTAARWESVAVDRCVPVVRPAVIVR